MYNIENSILHLEIIYISLVRLAQNYKSWRQEQNKVVCVILNTRVYVQDRICGTSVNNHCHWTPVRRKEDIRSNSTSNFLESDYTGITSEKTFVLRYSRLAQARVTHIVQIWRVENALELIASTSLHQHHST